MARAGMRATPPGLTDGSFPARTQSETVRLLTPKSLATLPGPRTGSSPAIGAPQDVQRSGMRNTS